MDNVQEVTTEDVIEEQEVNGADSQEVSSMEDIQKEIESLGDEESVNDDIQEETSEGKEEISAKEGTEEEGAKASEDAAADEETPTEVKLEEENTSSEESSDVFTPDLTFTFRGKKHEMPEELKGVIDSAEKQEFYQDLFSKAEGLPLIKEKGMQAQHDLDQINGNLNQFYNAVQMKDYDSAFKLAEIDKPPLNELIRGFGYSDKDLITLAYERAQLTPEQIQSQENQNVSETRIMELEQRVSQSEAQRQAADTTRFRNEINEAMGDESVSQIVRDFDAKYGEGKFFHEVTLRGESIFRTENRVESPKNVVKKVIDMYNLGNSGSQQAASSENTQVTSQPASNKRANKKEIPVIPAVESGGGSPGGRVINSMDDVLKEYAEEFGGSI